MVKVWGFDSPTIGKLKNKNMIIKFLKPACGTPFNMAYSENEIAEVEDKKAQLLIDEGFAESAELVIENAINPESKVSKKAVKK